MYLIPRMSLLDDIFDLSWAKEKTTDFNVDIEETESLIKIEADLPGVNKDNIEVILKDGVLSISSTRENTKEKKSGVFRKTERSYGKSTRSFIIPKNITEEDIVASYKDGVLSLEISKKEQKGANYIKINDY